MDLDVSIRRLTIAINIGQSDVLLETPSWQSHDNSEGYPVRSRHGISWLIQPAIQITLWGETKIVISAYLMSAQATSDRF